MKKIIKLITNEFFRFSSDHKELVLALAKARNIALEYQDFRGDKVEVPFKNIVGILSNMNHSVYDKVALECEIEELLSYQWQNLLEPVTILNPIAKRAVQLHISEDCTSSVGTWNFISELGDQNRNGSFDIKDLNISGDHFIKGKRHIRYDLPMPTDLPIGYHSINIKLGQLDFSSSLIVTPATSYHPPMLQSGKKIWGSSVQLYTLRSKRNWGIGDFTDLNLLIEDMAKQGADIIGLNPLHFLRPSRPESASPYSPSSRSFINPIYIDIEQVAEYNHPNFNQTEFTSPSFQDKLEQLRSLENVDYTAVTNIKEAAFSKLYQCFCKNILGTGNDRDKEFNNFIRKKGKSLRDFAVFESMFCFFKQGWSLWPEDYRDSSSDKVSQFAEDYKETVRFYMYIQFVADEQLQAAYNLTKTMGMAVGLCLDLPVGASRQGADTWSNQTSLRLDSSIGAPPDSLSLTGQSWGTPPVDPLKLRQDGYQLIIKLFQDNMNSCGALRIDHAMFLSRLWWCPLAKLYGHPARAGAYVYYDLLDMVGILNLESHRNSCMIIAEDIGTVPEEVREVFAKCELYSSKVFLLEIGSAAYTDPQNYPLKSVAMLSNHDLPTVKAYWEKSDLQLRFKLKQFPSEGHYQNACKTRETNKADILEGLKESGIADFSPSFESMDMDLCSTLYKHMAASNAQVVMVQLENLMLISKPVNIPGVKYPSWRRKLNESSTELFSRPEVVQLCNELNSLRRSCG